MHTEIKFLGKEQVVIRDWVGKENPKKKIKFVEIRNESANLHNIRFWS